MATKKAEQTRARIYETALALFAERGYEKTTLRLIAKEAGTSLGLTYRYFAKKDDIVLELYRQTTEEFERRIDEIKPGTVAERLTAALELKIALCQPHRDVFGEVVPATLSPRSGAFALAKGQDDIRLRVTGCYAKVLRDASDADGLPSVERAALMCFVLQLALLFYWLHDDSAHQQRTHELVKLIADSLHVGLGLFMMPEVDESMQRLVALLQPLFGARAAGGEPPPYGGAR
jgi:AcrR family transcriptional regulator